jgi:hypothetical protein
MSNISTSSYRPNRGRKRQLEVLVAQNGPADTALTLEAFRVAGLTSSPHCVAGGEEALM